mmetsp:Transcript_14799/g.35278  ORF Transcript_14799/g.35278 Transcript_14799/m.35278 type:complete len:117 (-) Transcript_14799:262-612(-)
MHACEGGGWVESASSRLAGGQPASQRQSVVVCSRFLDTPLLLVGGKEACVAMGDACICGAYSSTQFRHEISCFRRRPVYPTTPTLTPTTSRDDGKGTNRGGRPADIDRRERERGCV